MMLSLKNKWRYIYLSPLIFIYIIRIFFIKFFFRKRIFILNTPLHGNLGDQAILLSEIKIIKDTLPGYKIVTIPNKICIAKTKLVAKIVDSGPTCIHGGGYLGDLWPKEDATIRKMLEIIKENKILFFPQTFYSKDVEKYFDKAKPIFEKNKNLIFFARDWFSYKELSENLKNKVFYSPDIVLYEHRRKYTKKNIVTVCFRDDTEKTIPDTLKMEIINATKKYKIRESDTVIDKIIFYHNRNKNVKSLMRKIGESKLLITDRLHGMIFAYLTLTPCLVFNSKSPKVKGVYKWLSKADYITFHDNTKKVEQEIEEMISRKYTFSGAIRRSDFDELRKMLKEITR